MSNKTLIIISSFVWQREPSWILNVFVQTKDPNTNFYQQTCKHLPFVLGIRFISISIPFFKTRFLYLPNPKTLGVRLSQWKAADANSPNNRGQIYDESPEAAKKEAKTFVDKMCPKHTTTPSINPTKMKECLPKKGPFVWKEMSIFFRFQPWMFGRFASFQGVIKQGSLNYLYIYLLLLKREFLTNLWCLHEC